jgi:hypothetical protein
MPAVNWLAVIAAALSMFVIGGLWYSPMLFLKQWREAAGLSEAQAASGNVPMIFGLAFVLTLLMAANLAFLLADPAMTLGASIGYAVAAGLGFAAFSLGVIALFERRPLGYFVINGGYLTVGFAVMGLILGLWH